ncbi:FAD-dependent oxidoreductase, partial [Escherichia coli]|uniref:FAD-dependent oxidoreductase n=1 Tax=Escherichia coli TaxID=562 RepID=UPI00215779D6|nr:FAD-dependent oxidoreductase [Escherichia coli]
MVVVGGGISGLAAALRLRTLRPGVDVTVLEGSPRLGGSLRVEEVGGVRVDVGAEAVLHRRPEATGLAREVGLGDDLVHPATTAAQLWNRGRLVPLPRTLMGVPTDLRALDGVLSA